jgi:steroid delta-isomerase
MDSGGLKRYIDFFEQLSRAKLGELSSVMTDDVRFVDPFNDVTGLAQVQRVFEHMFRHLDAPKFIVTYSAMANDQERIGLLRWQLDAVTKRNHEPLSIVGMSEVHFADDGRICEHVDHWDAGQQFYERLPLVGWLLRRIRASIRVK